MYLQGYRAVVALHRFFRYSVISSVCICIGENFKKPIRGTHIFVYVRFWCRQLQFGKIKNYHQSFIRLCRSVLRDYLSIIAEIYEKFKIESLTNSLLTPNCIQKNNVISITNSSRIARKQTGVPAEY